MYKYSYIIIFSFALLITLSHQGIAQADFEEPKCGVETIEEAKSDIEKLTAKLRIAIFRGHIAEMKKAAAKLERYLDYCLGNVETSELEEDELEGYRFNCLKKDDELNSSTVSSDKAWIKLKDELTSPYDYIWSGVCDFECHSLLARFRNQLPK